MHIITDLGEVSVASLVVLILLFLPDGDRFGPF
jgi:hypothetical protein